MTGIVFEITQLAVFDGPGIRTTVFLKGCPLRCQWCHNPEGLSPEPELMVSKSRCTHCGRCRAVCRHPDHCILCGACVEACPNHLRKICGTRYTPEALAKLLLKDRDYLAKQGGGVTFSGGEPTMQSDFLLAVLKLLPGVHKAIETCGYCKPEIFRRLLDQLDYVMMDLKLIDEEKHRHYTGVSNKMILENLEQLKRWGKPFVIRIPVIPGVNDDEENFAATARLLQGVQTLERVELLPYHVTAGAKYPMVNREYHPEFDTERTPNLDMEPFRRYGVPCTKL